MSLPPLSAANPLRGADASTASAPTPASAAPTTPSGTVHTAPARDALAAAVQTAAGLQDATAPLLADLAAALQRTDLPPDVRAAAVQVLGAELPLDPPPNAAALSDAVARSGLFLEADLAQGSAPDASDLKAALLSLSAALTASGAPGRGGGAGGAPPPYAGGPLQAQAAQASTLPSDAVLAQVLDQLARRTTAALSRQVLLQAGSTRAAGATARDPAHWLFELPLATAQGPAVAPFQVDRDGARAGAEDEAPVWRTRFSLDVAGSGPVHARVSLQGGRVRVALWAEDAATVQDLDSRREELMDALRADDFEPQLLVQSGAPDAAAPPAGRLVDRAV